MELCGSQQALHEECDIVEDTVMQDGCKLTRCIRCSLSTRIGMRTEFFENDRPMILGWIVTRVVRLRAVLVRVRFGSGTRLHFTTGELRNCRAASRFDVLCQEKPSASLADKRVNSGR